MDIQKINYMNNYNKKYVPNFKQIKPEYLLISGYGQDMFWARGAVKIIKKAKQQIKIKSDFRKIMDFIAKSYGKICHSVKYGEIRQGNGTTVIAGRYVLYKSRLLKLVAQNDTTRFNLPAKIHISKARLKSMQNKVVKLNSVIYYPSGRNSDENELLMIVSPDTTVIKPVFKEIDNIYKGIVANRKELSPENIEYITQSIAKIHWLLSQVRPYVRGSAGIADIFAKSLFEAKGIQTSSYKTGVNPNMEAFVSPLKEYVQKYKDFFSVPLIPIKKFRERN